MEINLNIFPRSLLIGFAGITVGCISAFSFTIVNSEWISQELGLTVQELQVFFARFLPGCLFGLAIAVIYFINEEQKQALRLVEVGAITVVGGICYAIALQITFGTSFFAGDLVLIAAPAGAAIGGFVATWIFVSFLQMVTNRYSGVIFMFSFYGGLIGALLIDSIAYVMNNDPFNPAASVLLLSSCVFFIGWQTVMLLIISGPLLKKADKQITTPAAVARPVNDAAPR